MTPDIAICVSSRIGEAWFNGQALNVKPARPEYRPDPDRLLAFRAERDWEQFHNARSLATALSVEASELLEHFIWARDADVAEIVDKRRHEIEAELADVGMLLAYLCHDLGVNLAAAVSRKMDANAIKYPVEKSRGRSEKYTRL